MKQTFKTATVVIAVLLAAMSCTKEIESPRASEGSLNISIQGGINDLTPAAEVKSTAGTVVRVNWEDGDTVYVYDGSKYLGKLKVSLKDGDARYAYLSNDGDINTPKSGTTKLTLVHVSNATNAPAVINGKIKIDLSEQERENFPYVVYGTLDYTPGQTKISDKFVPFEFATSVVKINCTGLDEELPVSKAELINVNTECVLTLSQKEAAIVSADKIDTLVRTGEGAFSTADGKAVFQMAVVNTDEATSEEKARTVILTQGEKEFISDFSATALQSGKAYNTICEFERAYSNRNELCFEALSANSTVRMMPCMLLEELTGSPHYPDLEYSTDGENWDDFIVDKTTIKLENVGDKVWLRGDNPDGLSYYDEEEHTPVAYSFVMNGAIAASGNIMSLIDKYCDVNVIPSKCCFYYLFSFCTSLIKAPELPATELKPDCYFGMFMWCSSLAKAPELPATELGEGCYSSMFAGCTSLTVAPELPAKELEEGCYCGMFMGCSSLTKAPELPAKELKERCYESMFYGCTSLAIAPELPAEKLDTECYMEMFRDCSSLTKAPELPATELGERCYSNMFAGCTSLKIAPELSASTLVEKCYSGMFQRCTSLSSITMLATDISAKDCLKDWVYGVSGSGTFIKSPEMDKLPSGDNGIPNGWTVKNYGGGEDTEVPEPLPGIFSVSETKKVHFSKGNLWADGSNALHFEDAQWKSVPTQDGLKDENHVSHFMWSWNISDAVGTGSGGGYLFCDEGHKVSVDNSDEIYYALSIAEWSYLTNDRPMLNVDFRYTPDITYGGMKGLVLYPDYYNGSALTPGTEYTEETFPEDCVFLPAAGVRDDSDVYGPGVEGDYWSSTIVAEEIDFMYYLFFNKFGIEEYSCSDMLLDARSLRLVTDVK